MIIVNEGQAPVTPPVDVVEYVTQAILGDSGIVLNGNSLVMDDFGVEWGWFGDSPWSPAPAPRVSSGANVDDHGDWEDSREVYEPRQFTLEGECLAPDDLTLHAAAERFKSAIGARLRAFRVVEPGFDRFTLVRRAGELLWAEEFPGRARFSVTVKAPDPRLYSTTPRTLQAPVPTASSRFTVPLPVPFGIGSSSVTREALNAGTETARPVWRLVGPMAAPVLSNPATGERLTLLERDGSPFVIAQGQSIVIDTAPSARTILLATSDFPDGDESLSRKYAKVGDFWGFGPGSTRVEMSATSPVDVTPGQFMATWRDTYL